MPAPRILGRSSSHFTRCGRIVAHELGLAYEFEPVLDLMAQSAASYAGNPALRLPILVDDDGAWYGALNICRELARLARREPDVVWPEQLRDRIAGNAQELVSQGMATEVTLIMSSLAAAATPSAYDTKLRASLHNSLRWLDDHVGHVLGRLRGDRTVSFFEVTLFCFVTHLRFRAVLDVGEFRELLAFCDRFAQRPSATATEYRFDPV